MQLRPKLRKEGFQSREHLRAATPQRVPISTVGVQHECVHAQAALGVAEVATTGAHRSTFTIGASQQQSELWREPHRKKHPQRERPNHQDDKEQDHESLP